MYLKNIKASVIVPVYNAKKHLTRCIDSILGQTHSNFELILVNDGSKDGSLRILEKYARQDKRIILLNQENQGQGVARNRALEIASGEYILFVDSDDFIEKLTLEKTIARAEEDRSDFVHFDWKLVSRLRHRQKAFNYNNLQTYWQKKILIGSECEKLMDTASFFSVTRLYRKSFLDEHEIKFGEGYIYEDNPFYVQTANFAQKVSLMHAPLYAIQPHAESTTRSQEHSDAHYKGHIAALSDTIPRIQIRSCYTKVVFLKYNLQKFMEYQRYRVPKKYHRSYSRQFVDLMSSLEFNCEPEFEIYMNRYLRFFINRKVFEKKNYFLFNRVINFWLHHVPRLKTYRDRAEQVKKKRAFNRTSFSTVGMLDEATTPSAQNNIIFLGFDFKYSGNSKHLFDEIIKAQGFQFENIFYVTEDEQVPERYRVDPKNFPLLKKITDDSSLLIAESWVPKHITKNPNAVWIQLWHGTPIKRMLFDSNEPEIIKTNIFHKIHKHQDLMRWDFLIADSNAGVEKFKSSFLFDEKRIIKTGYPRVEYLLEQKNNNQLKNQIKEQLGLDGEDLNKKVVLYAPTWRDYNYGKSPEEISNDHILDLQELSKALGNDYIILNKNHAYLDDHETEETVAIYNASRVETQDLLVISDILITDYSSIIFDQVAQDKKAYIYANDVERYQDSRGLYDDIWLDLEPVITDNINDLVAKIKEDKELLGQKFKDKYCYSSEESIIDFIDNLDLDKLNRNW